MHKSLFIINLIFIHCSLFGQPNHDARMLGLNGAYTTIAKGYQCIGVNPANLASYGTKSANIFNMSIGLSTNSLSIESELVLSPIDILKILADLVL